MFLSLFLPPFHYLKKINKIFKNEKENLEKNSREDQTSFKKLKKCVCLDSVNLGENSFCGYIKEVLFTEHFLNHYLNLNH